MSHQSVMPDESIRYLDIEPTGTYIDATFGRGGHSQSILDELGDEGRLIAIDRDETAISYAKAHFGDDKRFEMFHTSFASIKAVAMQAGVMGKVSGILFDLGVSSPQIDNQERGFSFMHDGPLDMRMDTTKGQTAAEWLASAKEDDIVTVLKTYGEERFAKRIARQIVATRAETPIVRTHQLAKLVEDAQPFREPNKHPATRTFQAVRIHINNELDEIKQALDDALDVLKVGGRLVVISFHSLEDRIVKQFIKRHSQGDVLPKRLPIKASEIQHRLSQVMKKVRASKDEVAVNPRARSAIMRVAVKCGE